MGKFLLAAVALSAIAVPASAGVTFTTSSANNGSIAIDPGYGGQTLIYDFNALSPGGNASGDYAILAAPGIGGVSAAPSGTAAGTNFFTVPFQSSSGTATLLLGGSYSAVSFYWGSMDSYQNLVVLGAGGVAIGSPIFGSDAADPSANGDQTGESTNRRIFLTANGGDVITGFTFNSNGYAFESDTFAGLAAGVPEPATWALMIGGFGLVGGAMRRRPARRTAIA